MYKFGGMMRNQFFINKVLLTFLIFSGLFTICFSSENSKYEFGIRSGMVFLDIEEEYLEYVSESASVTSGSLDSQPVIGLFGQYHVAKYFSIELGYDATYEKVQKDIDDTFLVSMIRGDLILGNHESNSLAFYGKAGIVFGNISSDIVPIDDFQPGFEAGLGISIPIKYKFSLLIEVSYYDLEFDGIDDAPDFDLSGVKFTIGATM
jgi:Outer membrane protein beta-barrel domain